MRVKLIRDSVYGLRGKSIVIDDNAAHALIKAGIATMSKDMTPDDYLTSGSKNGKPSELRINRRSKR